MSTTYRAIHWNRQKRLYDLLVFLLVFVAASTFTSFTIVLHPEATVETILLRGAAFLSIFLIQVLLCIGPLARLNPAFLPLLYNRRHLGITVFLLSSLHAVIVLIQHHALGDTFPLVSLFSSYAHEYREIAAGSSSIRNIPFEPFGALALVVLYLMAVTSHDFWLRTLGPSVWKCLHMLVYPAYAMLLLHVSFGFLQSELHFVYPVFVFSGFALVTMLHLLSAIKGRQRKGIATTGDNQASFVKACRIDSLRIDRGKSIRIDGQRLAVFRTDGGIHALSGVCRHQGGPLGEGQVRDGCITCPWHGWQYQPENGESPPPFNEHVSTYPVDLREGWVYINLTPDARGTVRSGIPIPESDAAAERAGTGAPDEFYVGYLAEAPPRIKGLVNSTALFLLLSCPLLLAILAAAQSPFGPGNFEFGSEYNLKGVYYASPLPTVFVSPDWPQSRNHGQHILLCGQGKFGIPPAWDEADGMMVEVKGSLIHRDKRLMLELASDLPPNIIRPANTDEGRPETTNIGPVDIVGELADTKCFLGVMKPGSGKVHRACAIRCLSGGIPPSILVESGDHKRAILLAGPASEPLVFDTRLAGLQIRVKGTLHRENDFSFIRADSLTPYDGSDLAETKPPISDTVR